MYNNILINEHHLLNWNCILELGDIEILIDDISWKKYIMITPLIANQLCNNVNTNNYTLNYT